MTSRDFAYWLQGYFELRPSDGPLTGEQADLIRRHLALVFAHEIDPSAGDAAHQAKLNEVHKPPLPDLTQSAWARPQMPDGTVSRC
jgi:hypothetical protein